MVPLHDEQRRDDTTNKRESDASSTVSNKRPSHEASANASRVDLSRTRGRQHDETIDNEDEDVSGSVLDDVVLTMGDVYGYCARKQQEFLKECVPLTNKTFC